MRVLITGSRTWEDPAPIIAELAKLQPSDVIIHGGCPTGADAIAHEHATAVGHKVEVYRAEWTIHGRAAGPIRNRQMIASCPDLVIAFLSGTSRGTRDCVAAARAAWIPVIVIEEQVKS